MKRFTPASLRRDHQRLEAIVVDRLAQVGIELEARVVRDAGHVDDALARPPDSCDSCACRGCRRGRPRAARAGAIPRRRTASGRRRRPRTRPRAASGRARSPCIRPRRSRAPFPSFAISTPSAGRAGHCISALAAQSPGDVPSRRRRESGAVLVHQRGAARQGAKGRRMDEEMVRLELAGEGSRPLRAGFRHAGGS